MFRWTLASLLFRTERYLSCLIWLAQGVVEGLFCCHRSARVAECCSWAKTCPRQYLHCCLDPRVADRCDTGVCPKQVRALQNLFAAKVTTTLPVGSSICETVFSNTRNHRPLALQVCMRIRGGWGELCTLGYKWHF